MDAILYLDDHLRSRGMMMTDLDDEEAENWMRLLRAQPLEDWDVYVESMVGKPDPNIILAMQAQYGDLYEEDGTWDGLKVLALTACTFAQGNRRKDKFKEVESFSTLAHQNTGGGAGVG